MKFVCQNCKAKYQIADEKVAGRKLKMKCRKCGTIIPVESGGPAGQSSPSSAPSANPSAPGRPAPSAPLHPPPSRPSVPKASAPQASPSRSQAVPSRPQAVPSRPSAASAPPPPRASSPGSAPPPRATSSRPVVSPAVAIAPAPRISSAEAAPADSVVPEAPAPHDDAVPRELDDYGYGDEEMTRVASAGALANAFTQSLSHDEPARVSSVGGADEWFVGVNGVPVGPVRLSDIRAKAATGAITRDSLVWRDGFEEWLPLGKFPELTAVVEEGMSSAMASAGPLVPTEQVDPFAPEAPDPFAVAPVTGSSDDDVDIALGRKRSGMSIAAIFAMVVAVAFGLTVGFVLFGGQKEKIIREIVEVPREIEKADTTDSEQNENDAPPEDTKNDAGEKSPTKAVQRSTGSTGKTTPTKGPDQNSVKGLSGLQGLAGPSTGPANGSSSSNTGRALDSGTVERTVRNYTSSVKRSCWQPALDSRDRNAPTSARVSVSFKVTASGRTTGVSTSGDPHGYHGLASCIARRVSGWSFPPSGGETPVNVPFVFAAQ